MNVIQPNFWKDPEAALRNAYRSTDRVILDNSMQLGPGGSTAVTAIVIDGKDLWVANIGDSRAVVCERGSANQITVDHEPHAERRRIEKQGGFVTTLPGNRYIYNYVFHLSLSALGSYQTGYATSTRLTAGYINVFVIV